MGGQAWGMEAKAIVKPWSGGDVVGAQTRNWPCAIGDGLPFAPTSLRDGTQSITAPSMHLVGTSVFFLWRNDSTIAFSGRRWVSRFIVSAGEMVSRHHKSRSACCLIHTPA